MIIHLSASGVPITWTITALYRGSYGIAHTAAETWYRRSVETRDGRPHDSPQFLLELDGDDEKGWTEKRAELWFGDHHLRMQKPDDGKWLVQTHTAPLPLSYVLSTAITEGLRRWLVGHGYLISRGQWMRRYPGQAMMAARFSEFNAAADAARDAGVDLPYERKWAPFMETPKGTHFPFSTGFVTPDGRLEEHEMGGYTPVVVTRPDDRAAWERFEDAALPSFATANDAKAAMRLLNSGWTPAEVAVLLADEPVPA
jgi:hypothetical protein